jgi:hypothetical protein
MSGGAVGDEGDGGRRTGDDHDGKENKHQATPTLTFTGLFDERLGIDAVSPWNVCCGLPGFEDDHERWATGWVALSVDSTGETAILSP